MPKKFGAGDLIPGLPDEVSELCLFRLPFPFPALLRSVSSTWNRTLSNPSFFTTKSSLSLTKPYLLALAKGKIGSKIQWQWLDPVSKNWFPLPPMPIPDANLWEPASMASSVAKEKGEMYVFSQDSFYIPWPKYHVLVYSVATNSWRIGNVSMKSRGSLFTSAAVGGKVFAFRNVGCSISPTCSVLVQCYDPVLNSLVDMAEMMHGIDSYGSAVIGKKIHATESWVRLRPKGYTRRGSIYDSELNTWKDMPVGMRKGWTGPAVTLGPNLFVLEWNSNKVKVYDHVTDSWMQVKGSGIPEQLNDPYKVAADDENGKIYVVGRGLSVAIATLIEVERMKWEIEWDVVKGPDAFSNFYPCDSQILYA